MFLSLKELSWFLIFIPYLSGQIRSYTTKEKCKSLPCTFHRWSEKNLPEHLQIKIFGFDCESEKFSWCFLLSYKKFFGPRAVWKGRSRSFVALFVRSLFWAESIALTTFTTAFWQTLHKQNECIEAYVFVCHCFMFIWYDVKIMISKPLENCY